MSDLTDHGEYAAVDKPEHNIEYAAVDKPEHNIESCPTCRPLGLVWDPRVDGNVVPCPYADEGNLPPTTFRRHIGDGELDAPTSSARKPTPRRER